MSQADKSEALVHKLAYHETMINNILDIPCDKKSVKLAAVERKIVALEELVLELPTDDESGGVLFDDWRDTISELYRRYFLLAEEKMKMKKPKKAVASEKVASKDASTEKSSTSDEIETGKEASASSGSVASSGSGSKSRKKSQSPVNSGDSTTQTSPRRSRDRPAKQTSRGKNFRRSAASDSEPVTEMDLEQQKELLRAFFDETFSKLTPVAEITVDSDLEGFRLYAQLINRCIRQFARFEDDTELMSKILSYALPKAPQAVVERFTSLNEAEEKEEGKEKEETAEKDKAAENADPKRPPLKGLRLLKKCLVTELTSFYDALKEALVSQDDSGDVVEEGPHTCHLCKSNDHYKAGCPQVRVGSISISVFDNVFF